MNVRRRLNCSAGLHGEAFGDGFAFCHRRIGCRQLHVILDPIGHGAHFRPAELAHGVGHGLPRRGDVGQEIVRSKWAVAGQLLGNPVQPSGDEANEAAEQARLVLGQRAPEPGVHEVVTHDVGLKFLADIQTLQTDAGGLVGVDRADAVLRLVLDEVVQAAREVRVQAWLALGHFVQQLMAQHRHQRALAVDVQEDDAGDLLGHNPVEQGLALELYENNFSIEKSLGDGGNRSGGSSALSVSRSNCVQQISVRSGAESGCEGD